ncbi:MAG: alcohol dehydrogenase catalytic domain-containing protein [Candidatus Accumulibacter sp.]|jgi:threonine dehydrogenase-like Zn-dependent dehydrogenase|nr:alcohol dehydrogenase catalytic domain-containing protein [Accumulibacter sp.]
MRAFYVEADFEPKPGYKLSEREASTRRSARGNSIWKNIRASVTDRPEPKPKGDEVLLKVGAAGICGTDAHLLRKDEDGYTKYDGHSKYPIITGHEFAGEVIGLGPEVKNLKIGDLVSVESMNWCGECDACRMGMFNQCKNLEEPGLTFDGGFAEYAVVRAKYCYLLNDIVNFYGDKMTAFELGSMIEPVGVAYNGLFVRGGGIRPGGHVVVFGAGPIGLAAISLMKTSGAAKLVCFETTEERRQLAKNCGADHVYDPVAMSKKGIDPSEVLMDLTNGRGIGLFAECTGATNATYPVMAGALAIGGKTVQIGHSLGKTNIDLYPYMFNAGSISGSNGQSGQGIYTDVIALMASGRIDMRKMVTGRMHLEDIEEGLAQAGNRVSGKILVSMVYPRKK